MPDYAKYFRTIGEMVVVRSITTVKSKIEDQRKTFMLLGYSKIHTGGTYRMSNIRIKCIILSRDIIWFNKTYREYIARRKKPRQIIISYKMKKSPINGHKKQFIMSIINSRVKT